MNFARTSDEPALFRLAFAWMRAPENPSATLMQRTTTNRRSKAPSHARVLQGASVSAQPIRAPTPDRSEIGRHDRQPRLDASNRRQATRSPTSRTRTQAATPSPLYRPVWGERTPITAPDALIAMSHPFGVSSRERIPLATASLRPNTMSTLTAMIRPTTNAHHAEGTAAIRTPSASSSAATPTATDVGTGAAGPRNQRRSPHLSGTDGSDTSQSYRCSYSLSRCLIRPLTVKPNTRSGG
jgi:hypothetical protein